MSGIIGALCSTEEDLKRVAFKRRKTCVERSVKHDEVDTYKKNHWAVIRRAKTKTRMKKPKPPDKLFEDRVWMIFYNLGFSCMNQDRNCRLKFNGYRKQIDVLAKDEDNIFVVECRSSKSQEAINARSALEELVGKREDIQKALFSEWRRDIGRVNLLVAINSQDKRDKDEEYVKDKRKEGKNIFLWSAREIAYIENLIRQVGSSAKYQLYSVIFADKRQKSLKKAYPAIRGKIAGRDFYTFLMSAKELLKYAYVHHRHLTGIVQASQVYQRMLRNAKLKEIGKFIDIGGYFPNSIIVNFSKPLEWRKIRTIEDIAMGMITLPQYFGSAWIIDGQHRLYGAARADNDVLVPVLAFEDMQQLEQANLFVEINVKQTSVPKHLLWDLYSDIYRESSDEKQKLLYEIAETAKEMEASGPLKGYIDIPSIPAERPVKLSLTTVCATIEKYSPWDHLRHPTDESKTPENAARLINSYFEVLKSLWPEDWQKGNKGVLLTNNGFGVFMMLFQDVVKDLAHKNQKTLLHPNKTKEFEELLKETYLTPLIEFLKTDEGTQNDIRSQTGRGPQTDNAGFLELKIQEFVTDFWSPRMRGLPPIPRDKKPSAIQNIGQKARNSESILRDLILEKLKVIYGGDKWWRLGMPGGPKKRADEKWMAEVKRKHFLQRQEKPNERKFGYLGLGDMIEVVLYKQNWDDAFEQCFGEKEEFKRRIKDIITLRNAFIHGREVDDQDVADGIAGLLWLSKCIEKPDLNPYV